MDVETLIKETGHSLNSDRLVSERNPERGYHVWAFVASWSDGFKISINKVYIGSFPGLKHAELVHSKELKCLWKKVIRRSPGSKQYKKIQYQHEVRN